MSENELETLMSQLHVDSQLNVDTNNLGIMTIRGNTTWSYAKEKTHTRNGRLRPRPLNDSVLKYKFDKPVYYIPTFGEFLVDDFGNKLTTFQVVQTNVGSIKFESLTKEQVISLFWNEHWNYQTMKHIYFRLKENIEKQEMKKNRARPRVSTTADGKEYNMRNIVKPKVRIPALTPQGQAKKATGKGTNNQPQARAMSRP